MAVPIATRRPGVGPLLREWRQRRRLSQLDLAAEAGVSTRHLSFLETGRAAPSREMVLHLAEHLDVPLRERNAMLLAAGYAPAYGQSGLDEPEMAAVRAAVDAVLAAAEPFPALAVDRAWNLVAGNRAVALLVQGVAAELVAPPANVLRLALHPDGLAPSIVNLDEVAAHLLARLHRLVALTGDPALASLYRELAGYPGVAAEAAPAALTGSGRVVVPVRLRSPFGELALFSTLTTFGTPVDITVEELTVESFFPADEATAAVLRSLPL